MCDHVVMLLYQSAGSKTVSVCVYKTEREKVRADKCVCTAEKNILLLS